MSEESLKVAVRTRPFISFEEIKFFFIHFLLTIKCTLTCQYNKRELEAKAKLVVEMTGNQTIITDPKTNEAKKFAYDYSYW